MFANEQVKQWETKVHASIAEAQKIAQQRARQVEADARKALELLGDRAQVELKSFLAQAKEGTRDQWSKFGGELIKFGTRLQEMSKATVGGTEPVKPVVVEVQAPSEMQ